MVLLKQQLKIYERLLAYEQNLARVQNVRTKKLFTRMKNAYRAYHKQHTQYVMIVQAYQLLSQQVVNIQALLIIIEYLIIINY